VERILRVTATVWRGAADAAASMKPEDLKPEDRDRLRELATLKVLWELLAAGKKNLDIVTWRREGFPEAEDFLHALESGGLHPLLEKWQELRRTIAANRPVPDPLDSNARRLTVLLAETLSRTGLGEGEAREKTAEAVRRIFPKKAKRRKGRPSILVDIDDDAIRYWQSAYRQTYRSSVKAGATAELPRLPDRSPARNHDVGHRRNSRRRLQGWGLAPEVE
jgi:hypothetical protein